MIIITIIRISRQFPPRRKLPLLLLARTDSRYITRTALTPSNPLHPPAFIFIITIHCILFIVSYDSRNMVDLFLSITKEPREEDTLPPAGTGNRPNNLRPFRIHVEHFIIISQNVVGRRYV